MQADLSKYGVSVVALSKDTVEEAAIHKKRDNLTLKLLSDEKLEVIRQYGVEHHKALNFTTGTFTIYGIPFSLSPPSFKTMAIPTTLLIDEKGVILWIDQAADYRIRSDEERVVQAVKNAFGETGI
ncbi:MAG: redoxin domain-containing protein [SAR324 cluster bacterium]|nr:redoxin domain-containing protein [SAR324 cluster bacterium]